MSQIEGTDVLYEVALTTAPSREWRVAFVRPLPRLMTTRFNPDIGRVVVQGAAVNLRAAPTDLDAWLRRIDRWIAYANSIVEE
jgi:hypothetical protein